MPAPRRLLTVLLCLAAVVAVPASAGARVPQGFVGIIADYPLLSPHVNLNRQLSTMVSSGVESLRAVFNWGTMQPYPNWSEVPVDQQSHFSDAGGLPFDFRAADRIVGAASQHGLTILPVVLFAPHWAAAPDTPSGAFDRPASAQTFAEFTAVLVQRYGPNGTYWRAHPRTRKVPIRMWQIWNEPNLPQYWPQDTGNSTADVAQYVDLVHAAHDAIKGSDAGAKVVLAGLPNDSWTYLRKLYSVPGARNYFDVAAVHPFTKTPKGVMEILGFVRQAMNRARDGRKPIIASEVSFPAAIGQPVRQKFGFETTEAGQARDLAQLLPMLAAHRRALRLIGFYHYNWVTHKHSGDTSFDFAGLFKLAGWRLVAKPAYQAFRTAALAMESCRVKGPLATQCRRR